MENPACKEFFMHGLGHSLGLGVHDPAPSGRTARVWVGHDGGTWPVSPCMKGLGFAWKMMCLSLKVRAGRSLSGISLLRRDDVEDWIASSTGHAIIDASRTCGFQLSVLSLVVPFSIRKFLISLATRCRSDPVFLVRF